MAGSIVIVGACGTGKSTLAAALQELGYPARIVAQEHSAIPDLWAHEDMPSALIMLDASPAVISQRRHNDFPQWLYDQQRERLRSAEAYATLFLHTDTLAPAEVQRQVIQHLQQLRIMPASEQEHGS